MDSIKEQQARDLARLAKYRGTSPEDLIDRYASSMTTKILTDALDPDKKQKAVEQLGRLEQAVGRFKELIPLIPRETTNDPSQR